MKSYEESIKFVVDNCTTGYKHLRYEKWVAYLMLADIYSKTQEEVCADISRGIEEFEKQEKERRRIDHKASNEARRLANLEKNKQLIS